VPCTVLDPFCGSGTTGVVARRLGRRCVGLDLSFDYLCYQARSRLALDVLDAFENGSGIEGGTDDIAGLPLFNLEGCK
jgi:adenine specific DNA methylase Mod